MKAKIFGALVNHVSSNLISFSSFLFLYSTLQNQEVVICLNENNFCLVPDLYISTSIKIMRATRIILNFLVVHLKINNKEMKLM